MEPYLCPSPERIARVLSAYAFPETLLGAVPYGQGHINETYCVVCQGREGDARRFLLQGLSPVAFPHPEELMENFLSITGFLKKKIRDEGGDPEREALGVLPTREGKPYFRDEGGQVWRLMPFIEGTVCCQSATRELLEESGRTFGRFQYLLRDFPAGTLHETIPDFHNTEARLKKLLDAVDRDERNRAAGVRKEIDFVLSRQGDCSVALDAQRKGILPLRVTHNDTKLNNILIDRSTGKGLCVLDLDTTMPGLAIYDFGDSIRFGANRCAEDERDVSRVELDLDRYRAFTRGFLQGTGGCLTPAERRYLPWGARLMTLECGIRFLTDYLEGDRYFHIAFPEHNLLRTRTQLKLVWEMERAFDTMEKIVEEAT